MNKAEFVAKVAARTGDKKAAQEVLDVALDEIQRAVSKGQKVSFAGFGVFEKRARAARMARNPRTGEAVRVKKTNVPAFRPGQNFKELVTGQRKPVKLAKKAAAKKSAKKTTAKKAAKKSTPRKAAKKTTRAAATGRSATKKTAKRAAAKKTAKKTAAKKATRKAAKKATRKVARKTTAKKAAKKAGARKKATRKASARGRR